MSNTPTVLMVVPTIPGREDSLARTLRSYTAKTPADLHVQVVNNSPTAGEGWTSCVEMYLDRHDVEPDYLHCTNDDIACLNDRWLAACIETVDKDQLPAPVVLRPDMSLESAGGQLGNPDNLMQEQKHDWDPVGFTTVPFMSWHQWQSIGMIPTHYCSDVWVSERGRQLGMETVLRHDYLLMHYQEIVGRGAGYSQNTRDEMDRATMQEYLDAAR